MDILSFGMEDAYRGGAESGVLERNLAAIARQSPALADRLRRTTPRPDVDFIETPEGVSARLGTDAPLLASARAPKTEGERLASSVDITEAAGICVLGFGLGYHVAALGERLRKTGVLICYEPDLPLLRAVLERVDHASWIERTNLVILTDPEDAPAVSSSLAGIEGVIALGFKFLAHPPSRARLGDGADRFTQTVTRVLKAVRTTLVTTLVQGETTLRNLVMNLDHYATRGGIAELRGVCAGRPAVLVAAGPSLERNIDLLAQPGVRDRVVIVAVQTVLKPLLARGIRPHYVTALDHHEISRRFYEGLTAEDVEGVTLVAEPKANPAILDAFPGVIRCPSDELLDKILGEKLARDMGEVEPGATVAHLAYYLARYLGCDPVILTGQDLAFTDGQYYSAGASIHEVWAPELGPFRTLETLEWERIARMRSLLRRVPSVGGGEVFTDEQMSTYLAQFEQMFAADGARGLRTIDATEGGVLKRGAETLTLGEALGVHAAVPRGAAPPTGDGAPADADRRRRGMIERLSSVRAGVWRVGDRSRETARKLGQILESQRDTSRVNRLINEINAIRDEVESLHPAFRLVQFVNQAGALNRIRADRALNLAEGLDPYERQRRQIERDQQNVRWLAEAADAVGDVLDAAIRAHKGEAPKLTRDPPPSEESEAAGGDSTQRRRVAALVLVDHEVGALGVKRELDQPFLAGESALRLCVRRLLDARELDEIVLVSTDPARTRAAVGGLHDGTRVVVESCDREVVRDRLRAVGGGRIWSPESWRGGIGGLLASDEAFEPLTAERVMNARHIDAAVFVGGDWALVDPALTDAIVDRYRSAPGSCRVTFTQAPAGLCGVLVDRGAVASLATAREKAGSLATIGALLGYLPIAPQADPIAKAMCVQIDAGVRGLCVRDPGHPANTRELIEALVAGDEVASAGAERIASQLAAARGPAPTGPRMVTLEPCTGRLLAGPWGRRKRGSSAPIERGMLPLASVHAALSESPALRVGRGPDARRAPARPAHAPAGARDRSPRARVRLAGVHVRTDLVRAALEGEDALAALLDAGADVISVDLLAVTPEVYHELTGSDAFGGVVAGVRRLIQLRDERGSVGGIPTPWIVPRITRCQGAIDQVQAFHDTWIMTSGASVIDPIGSAEPGARIAPLPVPNWRRAWWARERMTILSDGTIVTPPGCDDEAPRVGTGVSIEEIHRAMWRAGRDATTLIEAKPRAPVARGRAA
ncbi:MAG: 6-hydroxymethylpterin diphosphokinase MptE-like protein [Phycisphaerales bacterium]